jgi:hypothetical protein
VAFCDVEEAVLECLDLSLKIWYCKASLFGCLSLSQPLLPTATDTRSLDLELSAEALAEPRRCR